MLTKASLVSERILSAPSLIASSVPQSPGNARWIDIGALFGSGERELSYIERVFSHVCTQNHAEPPKMAKISEKCGMKGGEIISPPSAIPS